MKYCYRLLIVLLALLMLAGCDRAGDEEGESQPLATSTTAPAAPAATAATLPTAAAQPTTAAQPTDAPTDTPAPTATVAATATATAAATAGAAGQDTTGAGDPAQQELMGAWQPVMAVAALDQSLCVALQGLAQTGQGGGLGALAVTAGLAGAGGVLQSAQQQLAGVMSVPGLGALGGLMQADQTALGGVIGQWSGGQLDAAGASSALAPICAAADATLSQTQQGAQAAGLSAEQAGSLLDQAKRGAAGLVGGINP
ncbi:hypothetical protein [Promineifilum sp.]|uniref:hypothetical protein n=1 Tax=Promineifilum sp. TaxID=2664178 RepID=UPI0035B4E86D